MQLTVLINYCNRRCLVPMWHYVILAKAMRYRYAINSEYKPSVAYKYCFIIYHHKHCIAIALFIYDNDCFVYRLNTTTTTSRYPYPYPCPSNHHQVTTAITIQAPRWTIHRHLDLTIRQRYSHTVFNRYYIILFIWSSSSFYDVHFA